MGRPKKHIAIQDEFGFVPEVTKPVQESPPQDSSFEKSLKKSIKTLNRYPAKSMTQKDNPIINEKLAQELQLPVNKTQIDNCISMPPCNYENTGVGTTYPGAPAINTQPATWNYGPLTTVGSSFIQNDNPLNKTCIPPQKLTRNSHGLYTHINYIFGDDGFVNWRAMIPVKYLYVGDNIKENPVRRELFTKKYGKKPEQIDLVVDKVEDKDLLITLAGIRYLAALRGYDGVRFTVLNSSNQSFVVVNCEIDWWKNFEIDNTTFGGVACASTDNTNGVFKTYLPEMASNRAFCRAVRNFLNIDVVSDEEAFEKKDDPKAPAANGVTPYGDPKEMLKAKLEERGWTFEKLKEGMIKKDKEWEKYSAIIEVPSIKIFDVLGRLKQKEEKEKNPVAE